MQRTLSSFYPPGTAHYYGTPLSSDASFFAARPAWSLDVLVARTLVCAGPTGRVVAFPETVDPWVWRILRDELGVSLIDREQVLTLPWTVATLMSSPDADNLLKSALKALSGRQRLIMMSPWLDNDARDYYVMNPKTQLALNDKRFLSSLVPADEVPERLAEFRDGRDFADSPFSLPLPFVVKVASSVSGHGVRICRVAHDIERARRELSAVLCPILIEAYIESVRNVCVQFGVPYDAGHAAEVLGFDEQLIDPAGLFLGGIIDASPDPAGLSHMLASLEEHLLPRLRSLAFFGVGGIDVLIDAAGRHYWIDANLRMAGTLPWLLELTNGRMSRSMATLMARFRGSEADFRRRVLPHARVGDRQQLLHIIALARDEEGFRMSAAAVFNHRSERGEVAARLMSLGLDSPTLRMMAETQGRACGTA